MRKYLLPENGNFYKANLHCHTNISDGALSPKEVKNIYKEKGYSVIAYTDHDVMVPHPELADENFLPLNGYEMEVNENKDGDYRFKKTCHMCFVALDPDNLNMACYHRTKFVPKCSEHARSIVKYDESKPDFEREYTHECISEMMKEGRENGFFVTYNHPTWSCESYGEYIEYSNMHAMEICNGSCITEGQPEYNERVYDDMLRAGKRIYCIGADDNHNKNNNPHYFDSFIAYTMIKADELDYKKITNALVKGEFYASQGPEIYDLWFEDGKIHITCSEADTIRLSTGNRRTEVAFDMGEALKSAEFEVTPEDVYVRITVVDKNGKCANTNAYFTGELYD